LALSQQARRGPRKPSSGARACGGRAAEDAVNVMQYALFSITTGDAGALDEMNRFLRGHRILKVETQFCTPAWSFCVCWLENAPLPASVQVPVAQGGGRKDFVDYKKILPPEQFVLFARLRDERKKIAEETNMPMIGLPGNEKLAEIAKLPPPVTLETLKAAKILSKGDIEKYGERFLSAQEEHRSAYAPLHSPCDESEAKGGADAQGSQSP